MKHSIQPPIPQGGFQRGARVNGRLLNVMYSAGEDFVSIHKVHGRVAKVLQADFPEMSHWFLRGDERDVLGFPLPSPTYLGLSARQIKGSSLALLSRYMVRRRIRQLLDDLEPDALLIDGLRAARLMLPILKERPSSSVRVAVILHSVVRITQSDVELFRSFSSDRLQVVAVSSDVAQQLLQKHPMLRGWLIGIPNANDPADLCSNRGGRRAQRVALGFDDEDQVFGAVGRLSKVKNFLFLLRCFAVVCRSNPRAHLVILGEGEQRAEIERCIRAEGLERQVHLMGFREDVMSIYEALDWLVCPSLREGLGLIIGEALMAGTPVIVSDLPVFHEQLGEAGCYAPVNDAEAWERALREALALDSAQREQVYAAQIQAYDLDGRWLAFAESYRRCLSIE